MSRAETTSVTLFLVINEDGEFEVSPCDADDAHDRFNDNIGGGGGRRAYEINLSDVPLPVTRVLTGSVPAEADGDMTITLTDA